MAISGKVTLDLNKRTVGRLGLLRNRLTPTRGARVVSGMIATASRHGSVTVSVSREQLSIRMGEQETPIYKSEAYARCLWKAGVTEVEVEQNSNIQDVRSTLNASADYGPTKLHTSISNINILLDPSIIADQISILDWNNWASKATEHISKSTSYFCIMGTIGAIGIGAVSGYLAPPGSNNPVLAMIGGFFSLPILSMLTLASISLLITLAKAPFRLYRNRTSSPFYKIKQAYSILSNSTLASAQNYLANTLYISACKSVKVVNRPEVSHEEETDVMTGDGHDQTYSVPCITTVVDVPEISHFEFQPYKPLSSRKAKACLKDFPLEFQVAVISKIRRKNSMVASQLP